MEKEKKGIDKFFGTTYVEMCFETLYGRMPSEIELFEIMKDRSRQCALIYRANRKILEETMR
ncbi:MAG: hypothetical protein ACP5F1_00135 [Thermoplasmata archaeon]|nr:hypothetical protein [Thermoplasmata archaeon]